MAADTSLSTDGSCTTPPRGWRCTRVAGHEGPCAAVPDQRCLKTCPFCGGVAETDSRQPFWTATNGRAGEQAAVYCTGPCGATMTLCKPDVPDLSSEEALDVLVENWNKRASEIRNSPLLSTEAFAAKFKREPTSPSDSAWMDAYEAMQSSPEPGERELDQALKERDEAEEVADKLADAIAELTGCAIGEHSSGNCPWQNALYAAEEMGPINPAQMLNIVEHASQLEVDYSAEDDMEIIEGFDRLRELLRPWRAERSPETKEAK